MSTQQLSNTYLGLWINWSHGRVLGSTLTLSYRDGGLLTAFVALFVAIAGGALWRITAFIFHQICAGQNVQDGLHHQQQAILRNTSSPGAALWQFTHLGHFWWQSAQRPIWRSAQFSFLALLNLSVLAVASLFSSQLTRVTSNETLILSDNCGIWGIKNISDSSSLQAFNRKTLRDTISAADYARACYGSNPDTLQCNQYVRKQISSIAKRNATCPFASGICMMSDAAAYELDTGPIDSHFHLGINTPEKDRVTYRRRETCAPLNKEGYFTTLNVTEASRAKGEKLGWPGDIINLYNFGPVSGTNWTFMYNLHASIDGLGYGLSSLVYQGGGPSIAWTPVEALRRDDADVSIVFMTANSISYDDMVHDPFFAADQECKSFNLDDRNFTYCLSNSNVNVMACVDQHQFCNPNNDQCTDLTSSNTAAELAKTIGMNSVQQFIITRFELQLVHSSLYSSLAGRGSSALRAQEFVHDFQSDPLPDDQWMIEVDSWFNTGLARLQKFMVEYSAGSQNLIDGLHIIKPNDEISKSMCHNQLVHSTNDTISFSVVRLALVLIICSILIMTNLVLESTVGFIQRRLKIGGHRRLQWILDGKLQLQRMAFEEAGMGTWSGGAAAVPITKPGEKFGIPLDTDPDHPRLQYHLKTQGGSGEEYESARLMPNKTNITETTTQLSES